MKQALHGLLLGFAITAGAAQAANSVTTTNFDIATFDELEAIDMQVLSDTGSTVSLAINGLIPGANFEASSNSYGLDSQGSFNSASLRFNVRDGYRITALTFAARVTGTLDVTPPPTEVSEFERPYAKNWFTVSWAVNGSPTVYRIGGSDVDGSQPFARTVAQSIAGQTVLDFSTIAGAEARGYVSTSCTDHCWETPYPAFAALQISDVVMTAQIAAVPEPTTWMLLLGGLGVVGAVARRRKA